MQNLSACSIIDMYKVLYCLLKNYDIATGFFGVGLFHILQMFNQIPFKLNLNYIAL